MVDDTAFRLSFLELVTSLFGIYLFTSWYWRDPLLDAVPTVGFSDPILSYLSALRFKLDAAPMLNYGYNKPGLGLFKIATFRGWIVLASGPELIEDTKKAPDDILSLGARLNEFFQMDYTISPLDVDKAYHADVLRANLTRNLAITFQVVHDELVRSFDLYIPMHGDDWVKVPVVETMQRVICAISNRRDQGYLNVNSSFMHNILKTAIILKMFPKSLRPIVARVTSNLPSQIRQEEEFISLRGPLVEERFARMEEFGDDWVDKPIDLFMWLMSKAKGVERSLKGLARRLLEVSFAALSSTTPSFVIALYHLLSNPECIEPLRHEVETAVSEEGWTRSRMDKMLKMDSFLRECFRISGSVIFGVNRLALRPFTFSNGVTVPAGTLIAVPSVAIHTDGEIYPNPEEFDAFRFAKLRGHHGGVGQQATSTSAEYLPFGYGRQACPGRFFAVTELKALLAHILVTYDIKLEEGKQAPRSHIVGLLRVPEKANVMFRKRQK